MNENTIRKIAKDLPHYLSLFGVLGAAIIAFLVFWYDRQFQFYVGVATASAYFTWGVVHHYLHHDLDIFVLVEYATVALLGVVVLFSVIFWA